MRASARLRLTMAFTLGVLLVGAAIVLSVFLVMRYVPDYQLLAQVDPGNVPTSVPAELAGPLRPGVEEDQSGDSTGDESESSGVVHAIDPSAATAITIRGESDVLRLLLVTSGIVLGVTTLGCVALSWYFAGRVLRPVQALSEAASTAEHGAGKRIEVSGPADEFGRLATTLNEMFDRLDNAYEAQQRFAANASHELRTPLATTQAMLDVALAAPDAVDVPKLAGRLRDTNARSIGTVNALLELADAQSGTGERESVDLRDVVEDSIAVVRTAAADRGIVIDTRLEPHVIEGDHALLGSMVTNLLGNAVRHNVDGGRIQVVLDAIGIRVANGGAVIDPADVERLTEPFFRTAGRVAGSHGIGLALVAAVADLHGFELVLTAPPEGGLVVDLVIGAAQTAVERPAFDAADRKSVFSALAQ